MILHVISQFHGQFHNYKLLLCYLLFAQLEIQPRVVNACDYELLNWEHEQVALCVFSTSGDGKQTA